LIKHQKRLLILKETFISTEVPQFRFGDWLAPQFQGGGSTPTAKARSRLTNEVVGLQLRRQKCGPEKLIALGPNWALAFSG